MWITLLASGVVVGSIGAGTGTGALEVIAGLLAAAFAVAFVSWLVARRRDRERGRAGVADDQLPAGASAGAAVPVGGRALDDSPGDSASP